MTKPTLRQLDYLIALQNTGSFSRAAIEMNVTQSTLSSGLKELETILLQPLARRDKRAITLTPFGEEIAEEARHTLASANKIVERSRQMQEPLSSPLRLGVIPTIAPYLLPQILPVLQDEFPKLELQIFEAMSESLAEDGARGLLDLVLLALPYDTPGMTQCGLWSEEFLFATAQPIKDKRLSLAMLEHENLLLLDDGHCLRDHALSACRLASPTTRKTFSATSLPTLIQMVAGGYGATLLPEMVANSPLPASLNIRPFKAPKPSREIGLAWKTDHPKQRDFEILAETIKNAYKNTD